MSLTHDLIDGAYLEKQGNTILRCTRVFMADDIAVGDPFGTGRDPFVIVNALAEQGLPQWNEAHPADNGCRVVKHRVRGTSHDQCLIYVDYQRPEIDFPVAPNTFLIRHSSTVVQTPMQKILVDGHAKNLRVAWKRTTVEPLQVPEDSLTINAFTPFSVLTLAGIVPNTTNVEAYRDAAHWKVNDRAWAGKPKGYWLCAIFDSEISQLNAQTPGNSEYRVAVSFWSKVQENWMYDGILRHQQTGRYVKIFDSELDELQQLPYENNIRYPADNPELGALRAGPYPMANFAQIFGLGG